MLALILSLPFSLPRYPTNAPKPPTNFTQWQESIGPDFSFLYLPDSKECDDFKSTTFENDISLPFYIKQNGLKDVAGKGNSLFGWLSLSNYTTIVEHHPEGEDSCEEVRDCIIISWGGSEEVTVIDPRPMDYSWGYLCFGPKRLERISIMWKEAYKITGYVWEPLCDASEHKIRTFTSYYLFGDSLDFHITCSSLIYLNGKILTNRLSQLEQAVEQSFRVK